MKRVAILQSNYIPWKGYFDIIAAVDEFIIYDDVQYTKNDWRNRNIIKTPTGLAWITVPVGQNIDRRIVDVTIDNPAWQRKHWKTLVANYSRAPCFDLVAAWLEPIYRDRVHAGLSVLNRSLITAVCDFLEIDTAITSSADYLRAEGKTGRLVSLCQQANASQYISGPSARDYIETEAFDAAGVDIRWFDYSGYPPYPQLWGAFEHGVSILDLLFNCGSRSRDFMKR